MPSDGHCLPNHLTEVERRILDGQRILDNLTRHAVFVPAGKEVRGGGGEDTGLCEPVVLGDFVAVAAEASHLSCQSAGHLIKTGI